MMGAFTEVREIRALEAAQSWRQRSHQMHAAQWAPFPFQSVSGQRLEIVPCAAWYRDITVLTDDWVVLSQDGALLIEHLVHTPHLYVGRKRVLQDDSGKLWVRPGLVQSVEGRALLLGGSGNYYHWLIDYLPRLLLWKDCLAEDVRLLVAQDLTPYESRSLALLGYEGTRLVHLPPAGSAQVEELLLVNLLASCTVPHPKLPNLLRQAFGASGAKNGRRRRLYLSRSDASRRRLVNEQELVEQLEARGFEILVPGTMNFDEQVLIFGEAEMIVGLHGAAMTNMVFCSGKAHVIEIMCEAHRVTSMKLLARMCGHAYCEVKARVAIPHVSGNPLLGDWHVDVGAVLAAI